MLHALHGNAGLPDDLLPLLRAAGKEFQAWHLWEWLRDHGRAASFEGLATALNAEGGAKPRVLLGYSLGGRLALHALTQSPGGWDAAILLSTHPGLTSVQERAARLAKDLAWAARFRDAPWAEVMQAWNAQPVLAGNAVPRESQASLETHRQELAKAFEVWSLGHQDDLRPLLPSVTCPVLWMTGADDLKFTALAAEAAVLMPQGQHVIIPGAGHRVHLDQPAAVAAAVQAFLR